MKVNGMKGMKKFFKNNWMACLLGAGMCLLPETACFAASTQVGITPLNQPLTVIHEALTGPIPILVVGGAIAMGGMSWAMGWEQQVMMRCVKAAGGGAIAMGAGKFMESVLGQGAGCLF